MRVEKVEHMVYKQFKKAKLQYQVMNLPMIVDRWQYIYSSKKGKISLIKLLNYNLFDKKALWEIYCFEGELFGDVERFNTKKEAVKRIKELLQVTCFSLEELKLFNRLVTVEIVDTKKELDVGNLWNTYPSSYYEDLLKARSKVMVLIEEKSKVKE